MQHTQFSDTVEASSPDGLRIAFIHPDLGIGGAERLIVDAAVALQQLGHQPCIFTPFQDPLRTFPQVAPPNPQVPVSVVRPPIPRAILGRCQVSCFSFLFFSFLLFPLDMPSALKSCPTRDKIVSLVHL